MQATVDHIPALGFHRRRSSRQRVRRARALTALTALLVLLAVLVFAPRAVEMASRLATQPVTTYVVTEGDTLWDIAARQSTGRDLRMAVAAIQRANRLKSAVVWPGQVLEIPVAGR